MFIFFKQQLTESCVVYGSAYARDLSVIVFSLQKTACVLRLGSGLMVSRIELKFTLYSKIFLSL